MQIGAIYLAIARGTRSEWLRHESRLGNRHSAHGFEYDISLGKLLRAPSHFNGRSPDVRLGGAYSIATQRSKSLG